MSTLMFESSDGVTFHVNMQFIKFSEKLNRMLDGCSTDAKSAIPRIDVRSVILKKILQWVNHHKNDPLSLKHDTILVGRSDDISLWDANFLKENREMLLEITAAANYLQIWGLMEVTSKTLANMITGKTTEEMRAMFSIESDFTEDEEE